jgi:carbamoyl-phosphate synthase small subunit
MFKYQNKKDAILLLEDGKVFKGKSVGKIGIASGEICFNTGMTGYQEIFTDPSYHGQIVTMTNVHIGNYGIIEEESESSSVRISALVCKNFSEIYSRKKAEMSLEEYLIKNGIVGITNIDTRSLVRYIRDKGSMNAIVSSDDIHIDELKQILSNVPSMNGLELSTYVSTKESYCYGNPDSKYKIALIDLGIKFNTIRSLSERNCCVKIFPMNTSIDEMIDWKPNGFLISNGPGDPSTMIDIVDKIKKIIDLDYPVFGICLGHQLISSVAGLSTFKMHNGQRGINHPIKNLLTGKSEITSQNHGFNVSMEDALNNKDIEVTHIHLNDNTLAGLRFKNKKVFSVQYHPEAAPGPFDSRYLFDDFIKLLE